MSTVSVTIDGIILNCDDSILSVNIGNGYTMKKVYLSEFPYKDRIMDARNNLNIEYINSQKEDENGKYFFCLCKEDTYEITSPEFRPGTVINDADIMCNDQLAIYKDQASDYLYSCFSLLHVFKKGNIALKNIFLKHLHTTLGFTNTQIHVINNVSYNISDTRIFTLSANEIVDMNQFILDFMGAPLSLMKGCIDEFVWGLAQIDIPTAFEQYTTAMEMILLETNQQGKKECLSKRTALLLAQNDIDVQNIYAQMKLFYRYRSESLHEGDGGNITAQELHDMEDVVRKVLKHYLILCKNELQHNPSITWNEIKANEITRLKSAVQAKISSGVLS